MIGFYCQRKEGQTFGSPIKLKIYMCDVFNKILSVATAPQDSLSKKTRFEIFVNKYKIKSSVTQRARAIMFIGNKMAIYFIISVNWLLLSTRFLR